MKIKIKETGEIKKLNIYDSKSHTEWTADLIGNSGDFANGQFVYNPDDYTYTADQDTYDWWKQYIDDTNKTDEEIDELASQLEDNGYDPVDHIDGGQPQSAYQYIRNLVNQSTDTDYELHRQAGVNTMDEIKQEFGIN